MELPVFYRGPRAVITHSVVEVSQTAQYRFAVADLLDVHIVRHDPEPDASGRQVLGVSALAAAVVTVPVVGPVSILLAALLIGILVVNGAICLRPRRRRWWQVRAEYRGELVEVFSSRDEREFAEFCRGLVRSLEFCGR
ncbi:DUF6232 family protein [Actinoplanes sp. NBC_00393]|uniref:DUF6232 family protein n=1 Tax=Actinoplanes sp. NBC_00393 TaxID=2975953 RepID=UPI002E2381D0